MWRQGELGGGEPESGGRRGDGSGQRLSLACLRPRGCQARKPGKDTQLNAALLFGVSGRPEVGVLIRHPAVGQGLRPPPRLSSQGAHYPESFLLRETTAELSSHPRARDLAVLPSSA